jgi:signal transduction histidine kinase
VSRPLRVLIAEDSNQDAKLLIYELQRGGYDPLYERVDTPEAMAGAMDSQEWDLIIADYVMPHFSGLEALRLMQERELDLPFIIVSGKIGEDVAVEAMKAGAHDYLLKDNLTRLNLAIERELRDADMRRKRRAAEQALKEAQQQLIQAQKMDAVGQVAAGMAHEINNRLTAVLGHLDLCLERVKSRGLLHQSLLKIQKNIQFVGRLNNKLLLFGQKQVQHKEPLNLNQNISEMRDMIKRRLMNDGIDLHFYLSRNLWPVYADSSNMDQVIINLVINARDAMPNGGSITLKTENVCLPKSGAGETEPDGRNQYICFTVCDTGSGMDEAVLSRIFEPFFTTKERAQGLPGGTGLGLSIVYGIIRSHEGWIDVSSTPREGSAFKIFMPAIEINLNSVIPGQIDYQKYGHEGRKILLVEDDPEVLSLTRKFLKKNGYLVYPCMTAMEASAIFEQENGCFDLVLFDCFLHDTRGTDLVLELKKLHPFLNVLLVSGCTNDRDMLKQLTMQGIPFLSKPYTFEDLLKQIHMQSLKRKVE